MSGAFGVSQNSTGIGLQARDLRKILEGLYPSKGLISGGKVTGNQNLTYHISDAVGTYSRGTSDGVSLFYLSATDTPAVHAGSTQPRIDTVWVKVDDPELDDDIYNVRVGVTEGTPAQAPVAPTISPTVTRIMDMQVRPNVTNLSTGSTPVGDYDYMIPYGSLMGRLGYAATTGSGVAPTWSSTIQQQVSLTTDYIPTDRMVKITWQYRASTTSSGIGSFVAFLYVDGVQVSDGADECAVFEPWATQSVSWNVNLKGGARHVVSLAIKPATTRARWVWQGIRRLEVTDAGVKA